jgi:3-oxoadipate enol-lactonase
MAEVQLVRVGELEVACRIDGPPAAPVVLLAHGVLASHRVWDAVAERLATQWRVVRYDLRGHGGTTSTKPPYTMELLATDAVALLGALKVGQAHFVGTSLGGMFGQLIGARHGGHLLSLTLANTTAVQGDPQAWQQRAALALANGVRPLVEPTLHRWFTPGCFASNADLLETMRAEALRTSVDGFVGCAQAIQHLDHRALLGRIAVPTLIVAGEHDSATPAAESEVLLRGIRQSRLEVLPAAHQAAAECPGLFVAAWQNFIMQHDLAAVSRT